MITWVLAVTVIIGGEKMMYHEFPMASEEECKNQLQSPGYAVHFVLKMGDEFKAECIPDLPEGMQSS